MDKNNDPNGEKPRRQESGQDSRLATAIQAWMVLRLSDELNVPPAGIDIRKPLLSYGLDSVVAFSLTGELADRLGRELPSTLFWDWPTLEALASHLADEIKETGAAASLLGDINPAKARLEESPEGEHIHPDENQIKTLSSRQPETREALRQELKTWASAAAKQAIPVLQSRSALPLSFAQERLWFLEQLLPSSGVYNIPVAFYLSGPLRIPTLEQSLNEVLRRHEALRTTFSLLEDEPVQVIASTLTLRISLVDLRSLPETERRAEVRRLAAEEARRPFDLNRGPLLRATVLRLKEQEHALLLTMHHIVFDGWSMRILLQELSAFYNAFCGGESLSLAALPIQYADFAVWQRQWLQGALLERQLAYWKQQLAGLPVLTFGSDRRRARIRNDRAAKELISLSRTLTDQIKSLGRDEGITLFMTLLAAFQIVLYRCTGQHDIAVGTPIANRNRMEIEGLIGFFVNTFILRTDLSGNPTFRQVLERVRRVCLGAYDHQDLPFHKLVGELRPDRDLSHNPLFQVWFVLRSATTPVLNLRELRINPLEIDSQTARYELKLDILQHRDGMIATFEYNTDLFDAATVRRMKAQFETLLNTAGTEPDMSLDALLEKLGDTDKREIFRSEEKFRAAGLRTLKNVERKAVVHNPSRSNKP